MKALAAGLDLLDLVDHVGAADHLAEDGIAQPCALGAVWLRKALSAALMKNCALAEWGAWVRAIATVYLLFFRPLLASFSIWASVGFWVMPGSNPPPWTIKPGMTR